MLPPHRAVRQPGRSRRGRSSGSPVRRFRAGRRDCDRPAESSRPQGNLDSPGDLPLRTDNAPERGRSQGGSPCQTATVHHGTKPAGPVPPCAIEPLSARAANHALRLGVSVRSCAPRLCSGRPGVIMAMSVTSMIRRSSGLLRGAPEEGGVRHEVRRELATARRSRAMVHAPRRRRARARRLFPGMEGRISPNRRHPLTYPGDQSVEKASPGRRRSCGWGPTGAHARPGSPASACPDPQP
jgi:hypothetical protein